MGFSELRVSELFRVDHYDLRRCLWLDGNLVSQTFLKTSHERDLLPLAQCECGCGCPVSAPHCVAVRRVEDCIAWLPARGRLHGEDFDPNADLGTSFRETSTGAIWFKESAYRAFLLSTDSLAETTMEQIPKLKPTDVDVALRLPYVPFVFPDDGGIRRIPTWKEIEAKVLTRALDPKYPEIEAPALEIERARRNHARLSRIMDQPPPDAVRLVEYLDVNGAPGLPALAFAVKSDANLEAWAAVGHGCWGRLAF